MALGTISGLGVGSKLDLQGVLDKLRAVDDAAVTAISDKKTAAKTQLSALDTVNSKLLAVKSHALHLSLESNFLNKTVSGDDSVVSATATLGTEDGSHTVDITRLATKSSFQSASVATADTSIASAATTFEYKLGNSADTISVEVTAGTTLRQLVDRINEDTSNPGVTASLINTGIGATPFRLLLSADKSGEAQRITLLSQPSDLAFTELQGAGGASLNAALQVNGVSYERQSNSGITDVVQGLTLNLRGAGSSTVQVSSDTSSIQESLTNLVSTFQEALKDINTQTAFDNETKKFGALGSATGLRSARGDLVNLLGSTVQTGGSITSLVDLGLEFDSDGNVSLNERTLETALSDNFEGVKTLLAGKDGVTGLGTLLTDTLTDITKSTGLIASEKQAAQANIDRLDSRITTAKTRLDQRYDTLARQFAALDTYAAKLQQQGDSLTGIIDSLTNTKS
ncbi:MAG: flagellar filament capping protein FliD [Candidatus Tectimicrobiota bacterium]